MGWLIRSRRIYTNKVASKKTTSSDITKEEFIRLLELIKTPTFTELMTKLDASAMTLAINYGDSQVVKHLHLHLLPNFEIKESSMSVEEVYDILKED